MGEGSIGVRLGVLVCGLAIAMSLVSLLLGGGAGPFAYTAAWDALPRSHLVAETTLLVTPSNRDTDLVTLALAVPGLLAGLFLRRRSRRRAALLQGAVMGYILYIALSYALDGRATHELFPLAVALVAGSALGLAVALRSLHAALGMGAAREPREPVRTPTREPRPGSIRWSAAVPLIGLGALLLAARGWPLVAGLVSAAPPPGTLAAADPAYSSPAGFAMDLGILAPGLIAAGVLIIRGRVMGLVLAVPLLGVVTALGPVVLTYVMAYSTGGPGGVASGGMTPGLMLALLGLLTVSTVATGPLVRMIRRSP